MNRIYLVTNDRINRKWIVTNTVTGIVHSKWEDEPRAKATCFDLNSWPSVHKLQVNNVIPLRKKASILSIRR
jgi:hypothetical protein